MKKLLLFVLILFSFSCKAQTYHPFPTNYGNWIYQYYDDFHLPTSMYTQYTLNGDTVISSVNYKKIFRSTTYQGALRENSKIIYFIPDTSSSEFVLYNFNLVLGDTIFNPYGGAYCSNDTAIVEAVDSVLLSDGYHRTLYFNSLIEWVEGIGSYNYLLKPTHVLCVSGNDWLECMTSDSSFVTPSGSSCALSISDLLYSDFNISIFPNPSNGSFTIDFDNIEIKEILLSNILGQVILKRQTNNLQRVKIDNLQSGTYILTLVSKDRGRINRKVISSP